MFHRSRETGTRPSGYDFSDKIRRTCLRGVMPGVMYCGGAIVLQTTDPHAANAQWAEIDHELVDAAPWIPYSNGRALDFVSKRVGNFQFHPVWEVLFDQLWVR
jgi:hypothetical protein